MSQLAQLRIRRLDIVRQARVQSAEYKVLVKPPPTLGICHGCGHNNQSPCPAPCEPCAKGLHLELDQNKMYHCVKDTRLKPPHIKSFGLSSEVNDSIHIGPLRERLLSARHF
jgi:hypothetical protein